MGHYGGCEKERCADVDIEYAGIVFCCRCRDGPVKQNASVVDEDIDLITKRFSSRRHDLLRCVELFEVSLNDFRIATIAK